MTSEVTSRFGSVPQAQAMVSHPVRVAVIGAGPAGVYAADALVKSGIPVSIDVLDRLPTPYGLVRYGVAPDHPKTKTISEMLRRTLENPAVRFIGNVTHGVDLHLADLRPHYDAVLYAIGADDNRRLGIPGETLPGSISAAEFVAWYNAHPYQAAVPRRVLDARSVAIVGAGNVALDVARILLTGAGRLIDSDVPDHVLAELRDSAVTDVHLLVRRGPAQVKFTVPELREIGGLDDVDVLVEPTDLADLGSDSGAEQSAAGSRRIRGTLDLLREWSRRGTGRASRRIHFSFWQHPVAIVGTDRVEALSIARMPPAEKRHPAAMAPSTSALRVQAVVRAIGYRGRPINGLPFDAVSGTVPNRAGRVVDGTGNILPGVYVAGWIKRGPTGVIGTNKADAAESVRSMLADITGVTATVNSHPEAVTDLLNMRGIRYVTWADWLRLDAYEIELGRRGGRARVNVGDLATMLDICRPRLADQHYGGVMRQWPRGGRAPSRSGNHRSRYPR